MAEQRIDTSHGHRDGDHVAAGFRAFLISDIRGYSTFAAVRGDEAAATLTERFVALAERVVTPFGGEMIGTRGDEVLFAFESPRQALRAAVAFERALLDATRDDPTLPMPAGVGIDIGEAVVVSDGWRANAINVAARLCSIARGGEILATPEVTHLAQAVDGITYTSRPRTQLKGIAQPVSPVRVAGDDLDTIRGFADLGVTHAVAPPARRRPRVAFVVAVALIGAAVIAGIALAGGSSSVRLGASELGAIDTGSGSVTMALHVASPPTGVAVGRDGSIWVTSTAAGTLSRIDPKTHSVIAIAVGSEPTAVTVAPDGSVWVANSADGTVSRVNPESDSVVARVDVGAGPTALAATTDSVWVANTLNGSVSEIALRTAHVSRTLAVGSEPAGIAVGGGSVWIADQGDGTVYRLDQNTGAQVAAPIAVGAGPVGVAFGKGAAWVANSIDGTLSRIDAQSNRVTTRPVGEGPVGVAIGANRVWVSDEYGEAVAAVDPSSFTVTHTTSINSAPLGLALAGNRLWIATDGLGAAAHRGGVLAAIAGVPSGFPQDIPAIDQGSAYTPGLWRILVMTSDGLVGYRKAGGVAGSSLVPDLAVSLPIPTDNGLTYTFRIRPGIRYSNGVLVRASDFRRGLERSFVVGGGPVQYFGSVLGAQRCMQPPVARCDLSRGIVTDDATNVVTFHLSSPDADLLNQLTLPAAYPVPAGTSNQLPVGGSVPGTGPYEVSRYSPVTSSSSQVHGELVLKRNPYFHQWSAAAQPNGFPDQIVVHTNYSPQEEVSAVERGRADFAWDPPPASSLSTLTQTYPAQLHQSTQSQTTFLWLNVKDAPFDSVLARQALNYAVDRNSLANLTPGGLPGRPTCQLLPPNFPGYVPYCPYTVNPSSSARWLAPDLAKARALVRESGTFGAHVILLTYPATASYPGFDPAVAQAVVRALRGIGYRAQLKVLPLSVYFGPNQIHVHATAQAGTIGWLADYVAPSAFLIPLVGCGQGATNAGQYCDPALDARINKALSDESLHPGEASREWTAIDHSLVTAAADVPLSNSLEEDFVSRRVGNYTYNPQWGALLDQLWVR